MPHNANSTALSSWILLLARAIDSHGYDSAELFAKVGLDHSLLRDPGARFSYAAVTRLWTLALETTGDACIGLTVASLWHPTTLHALGYSWFASNSLDEAYERMKRYSQFMNTAAYGALRLSKSEESYSLTLDPSRFIPPPAAVSIDAGLAMIVHMSRAAYGDNFHPIRVSIQRDKPDDPADVKRFSDLFEAPVSFSQPENTLWLDSVMVYEPLVTANPELARVNDSIVAEYLAQLDRNDVTMRVRSELIERLPTGQVSEEGIASSINVSQRSLQRRLKEQGMSFTQLLENTRKELGLQYVRDPQHSFNEIAYLLGFAEPGNFSRAFKRWHGKSPSQYRQELFS